MAQKILLRRGPISNLSGAATQQGELLLATGSLGDLSGPILTMTGTSGTNTSTLVGKIYSGATAPTLTANESALSGTPFYSTGDNVLYILDHNGNVAMDLTGNLEGRTVTDLTVTTLTGTTIDISGDITGSNMHLTGNAKIDGNIVLGGNINIGDASTDTITLGGEVNSDILPDADDTYSIGTPTQRFILNGIGSSISGSFSGSFQGDGSNLTGLVTALSFTDGATTQSLDLQTGDLLFTEANAHGFEFVVSADTITLNTPQDLQTTATADFADVTIDDWGSVSASLESIQSTATSQTLQTVTDNGSTTSNGITVATTLQVGVTADDTIDTSAGNLRIGAAGGEVSIPDNLTIGGNLTVSGTTTTVNSTEVNIGDNIITLNAAGTVADGGVQVIDTTGTAGTGSILWNATDDYWYAGVSGSTHYRIATYTNATPTSNALPKIDANKRLVASSIADDGTTVTVAAPAVLENALTLNGLTSTDQSAGARVLFADASNVAGYMNMTATSVELSGVVGINGAGDLVMSDLIDGGTF